MEQQDRFRWRGWWALLLFAFAVRGMWLYFGADSLSNDPDAYRALAENLRRHGVFGHGETPTAFRPPLYPLLLAAAAADGNVQPAAAAAMHLVLGVATVMLTYALAVAWGGQRWSLLAGVLVAADPILLNQSTLIMTETLAAFLAAGTLVALTAMSQQARWWDAIAAGVLSGLAALCRPTFLPWTVLVALGLAVPIFAHGEPRRRPHRQRCLLFCLSAALVLAPWGVRNWLVLGVPKLTTTHGGFTLLLGNNPLFYRYLREHEPGVVWEGAELARVWERRRWFAAPSDGLWREGTEEALPATAAVPRSELEDDVFAYALARRSIQAEPAMFAWSCLFRAQSLWQLAPQRITAEESGRQHWQRVVVGVWYAVLFLLAVSGAVAERRRLLLPPRLWGLLLCLTFTLVHLFYWSNMRMRAPLMPFVCVLAAEGAAWWLRRGAAHKP